MNETRLRQLLVLSGSFKEGDAPLGAAHDEHLKKEAQKELASIKIGSLRKIRIVDDAVSEFLDKSLDPELVQSLAQVTIGNLKKILLSRTALPWIERHRDGLPSEAIAATAKLMTDDELSYVARLLYNSLRGNEVAIGSRGHFGSRIQPNSPGDNEEEILFSILEGLSFGCGDVILGINPASDDVDTIVRLEQLLSKVVRYLDLPVRYCVLSDIIKQTSARARSAVDIGFQSLAGTSSALVGMVGLDIAGITDLARGFEGLYFETGQGSEVTNGTECGVDMVTLEARSYGVARAIRKACPQPNGSPKWMIVNDVAGFIGPEVFCSSDQLKRACLEDAMMAKLHDLTMGLDVCSTFHMGIAPKTLHDLTTHIVDQAAPAYLMAVAGNADPMLGYMTTSFREHPALRAHTGKSIATPMKQRLAALGIHTESNNGYARRDASDLYAIYAKASGDRRTEDALRAEGVRRITRLQSRGFDLGLETTAGPGSPAEHRMQAIYEHARHALYSTLNEGVISDVAMNRLFVRTNAIDRNDYLSHPPSGEQIAEEDIEKIRTVYPTGRPQCQIVISDGLNANAVNENLKEFLPALRKWLSAKGVHTGDTTIVVRNGRVRAGYNIGVILAVEVLVHLIGERPGTGVNTMSAYVTYGRNGEGKFRWRPDMDHSMTTAICGINRQGKHPLLAAEEVGKVVRRMIDERKSGVRLT